MAALYGVETREVNQAVRNNPGKFREGYIFELTTEESAVLRSNYLTLEHEKGKGRYSKYNFKAFTERGLYMLATILRSKRAEDATVAIVETFFHWQTQAYCEARPQGEVDYVMYEKNEAVENFDHLNCLNYTFVVVKIKHKVVRKGDI